jgi:hypothetical protein
MNLLTEDQQEAAIRCIVQVDHHGGQASETLPTGDTAYAYRKSADCIAWGLKRSGHPSRIDWSAE